MSMAGFNPHFEVRPSLITGDTAELYLHRTMRVLRNEGINPMVAMEFYSTDQGVLCGAQEVKAVLSRVTSEANREVWAMEEGQEVGANEVALLIRAPYTTFGLYETAICGILAHSTGWATAARECTAAARGIPIVSVGAHNVHPSVAPVMDYAAVVGGCFSASTVLGTKLAQTPPMATVSGALVQIMGDPESAAGAFDRSVAPDVPRVAYVDPRGDVVAQAIEVAQIMKDRLNAIRLARVPGAKPIPPAVVKEVRNKLNESGFPHVEILLSGEMSPTRIRELVEADTPVDVLHDTGYIASAKPSPFRPTIRTISDLPVPQEQEPPPPNPKLIRLL